MIIGNIYINGAIGVFEGEPYTELVDVVTQATRQKDATEFIVHINSVGGYVSEGEEIYNYLKSLKKPITTIGTGLVASIATVIFMAGDKRMLRPNTEFMIHLPSGSVSGTSEEVAEYSSFMQETEKKMIKFYEDHTDLTKEAIKPLLSKETWLDTDKAYELGFTNVQTENKKAVAIFNNNKKIIEMAKQNKKPNALQIAFAAVAAALSPAATNLVLADANDVNLDFADLEDGTEPQVDDVATVDGTAAEGEYVMPDGKTFIFSAGVLTEIKPADDAGDDDELTEEEMQLLIDLLTTERDEAIVNLTAVTTERDALIAKVDDVNTKFATLKTTLKSKFGEEFTVEKPAPTNKRKPAPQSAASEMKKKLAAKKARK
jgi:ATP-dependent protease ClpP protease subunit